MADKKNVYTVPTDDGLANAATASQKRRDDRKPNPFDNDPKPPKG